jgi:hypothetical protein
VQNVALVVVWCRNVLANLLEAALFFVQDRVVVLDAALVVLWCCYVRTLELEVALFKKIMVQE